VLFELAVLIALVLANGLFAGAEIAVLTAKNPRSNPAVLALREKPERFLATVQIGITVISAAAAAFGGARIASELTPHLVSVFGDSAHEVAMVIVVAAVSFLSLVLGELVPKSLALRYSGGYARMIGRPLLALSRIMRPLVWFLTACSNAVLRLFGDSTSFTEARTRWAVSAIPSPSRWISCATFSVESAASVTDLSAGPRSVWRERRVLVSSSMGSSWQKKARRRAGHTMVLPDTG
jgi:CBS domain containing-hemolysin-like protein